MLDFLTTGKKVEGSVVWIGALLRGFGSDIYRLSISNHSNKLLMQRFENEVQTG